MDWISAVPPSWGSQPVRPVTLRRHLSMALPLSKSRRNQLIRFAASPNLLTIRAIPLRPPASRRRQEVDRVHDRHGLDAFLRAEIDCLDAAHDLSGEIRRIHVSRLQLAH